MRCGEQIFDDFAKGGREIGERAGTRTLDLLIKSQLLYRLSYALVTWRMSLKHRYRFSGKIMRLALCRGDGLPGQ